MKKINHNRHIGHNRIPGGKISNLKKLVKNIND